MPKRRVQSAQEIEDILGRAVVGRLSTCRDGQPYVTPLAFVFREGRIYFHSAPKGRKMENLKANPRVCFEVDEVEKVYLGERACDHSIRYASVIATGEARIVADAGLKRRALEWLVEKYAGAEASRQMSEREVAAVEVVEIEIEELTGKRNVD